MLSRIVIFFLFFPPSEHHLAEFFFCFILALMTLWWLKFDKINRFEIFKKRDMIEFWDLWVVFWMAQKYLFFCGNFQCLFLQCVAPHAPRHFYSRVKTAKIISKRWLHLRVWKGGEGDMLRSQGVTPDSQSLRENKLLNRPVVYCSGENFLSMPQDSYCTWWRCWKVRGKKKKI